MTEEYDDGRGLDPRTREDVLSIAADALATDGQDPLDEATRLAIRHRDESELTAWVAEDGFALLIDTELSLVVRPSVRGSGIGGSLLDHVLEVLYDDEPLTAWAHGDHPAAARLAARAGMERARDLWVMRSTGESPLGEAGEVGEPEGVVVRGFRPGDEDELLRVNAAAFAGHFEQGALDADGLAQRMAEPWFSPEGLLIALDGDRVLGFHWTKVHPDSGEGEVYVVGIDPAAQGRGLGRLLTVRGLEHLASLGVPSVHLYVESDNAAAIALYESLGFRHDAVDTHVQYRRPEA